MDQPYVNYLFDSNLKKIWSDAQAGDINPVDTLYDNLNQQMSLDLINILLTDPRGGEDISVGFKFGYKDDKVTYEDLLYVNPEATDDPETWEYTYEEEDRILGKSATNHKRVKFLDPVKYGGKYTRPKNI